MSSQVSIWVGTLVLARSCLFIPLLTRLKVRKSIYLVKDMPRGVKKEFQKTFYFFFFF